MANPGHAILCQEAAALYLLERNASSDAEDWKLARWEARKMISGFLRASDGLTNVSGALEQSGRHMTALRHLLAPPISQDQFLLLCRYTKGTEKSGNPIRPATAAAIALIFEERLDRRLAPWLSAHRSPRKAELLAMLGMAGPLIASQRVLTARRTRLARLQEQAVIDVLKTQEWTELPSHTIAIGGALSAREFMHKVRFASADRENKEIDIACGLGATKILAVECKVTNDKTNSIKRVDDVLTKTNYWKDHWGTFLKPAAILQGNVKLGDVQRLVNAGVEVFWSHRLDIFTDWLDANVN